jgi:hypothetical protein
MNLEIITIDARQVEYALPRETKAENKALGDKTKFLRDMSN